MFRQIPVVWLRRFSTLLRLDSVAYIERFRTSPIARIGRDRLVRNACIAAGNWGDPQAIPPLEALLNDANPLVRGHAVWALGRIGERRSLAAHYNRENDMNVRAEIENWI